MTFESLLTSKSQAQITLKSHPQKETQTVHKYRKREMNKNHFQGTDKVSKCNKQIPDTSIFNALTIVEILKDMQSTQSKVTNQFKFMAAALFLLNNKDHN